MPSGVTTYPNANGQPRDGRYAISSSSNGWFGWHNIEDHTEGDVNGRMLIINADDDAAGEFYFTRINGLCENTTYEFSSWMINLIPVGHSCNPGIPINVRFEIWDNTNTNILAIGDTGSIGSTVTPNWEQYALVFQTETGQTSVILKMLNNGIGGCGNDLALDDIVFKSCGDRVIVEDDDFNTNIYICPDEIPFSTELVVIPDFTIFSSHFYQWQESTDGIVWNDISGATSDTYTIPSISMDMYYRSKVAEDAVNLNNDLCNTVSDIYEVVLVDYPDAPLSDGDLNICENDTTPLSVSIPDDVVVNWYDAPTGGNLLLANSETYNPTDSGTYYAEAISVNGGCPSVSRTALVINFLIIPEVEDEILELCEDTSITLSANVLNENEINESFLWSNNGETTESIDVFAPGIYTVDVFSDDCMVTKTVTVNQLDNPIIENVISDGKNIVVSTSNTGDFLYSIDGNIFTTNNTFLNIESGIYTIYVKQRNCDFRTTTSFVHFFIPKFFTPNGDGKNDEFDLSGLELYSTSSVSIFNRYGKLLKNSRNRAFTWDGSYAGNILPTDDYWYVVVIDGQKLTGCFTLKR